MNQSEYALVCLRVYAGRTAPYAATAMTRRPQEELQATLDWILEGFGYREDQFPIHIELIALSVPALMPLSPEQEEGVVRLALLGLGDLRVRASWRHLFKGWRTHKLEFRSAALNNLVTQTADPGELDSLNFIHVPDANYVAAWRAEWKELKDLSQRVLVDTVLGCGELPSRVSAAVHLSLLADERLLTGETVAQLVAHMADELHWEVIQNLSATLYLATDNRRWLGKIIREREIPEDARYSVFRHPSLIEFVCAARGGQALKDFASLAGDEDSAICHRAAELLHHWALEDTEDDRLSWQSALMHFGLPELLSCLSDGRSFPRDREYDSKIQNATYSTIMRREGWLAFQTTVLADGFASWNFVDQILKWAGPPINQLESAERAFGRLTAKIRARIPEHVS